MRKILIICFLMLLSITETFAYAMKVYDEYGNRIGTYRSGFYGNDGMYYPRGYYIPTGVYVPNNNYIVRPNARNVIRYNNFNRPKYGTTIIRSTDIDPFTNTLLKF